MYAPGLDLLRSSILITLQEGNIIPGLTTVLKEILSYPELLSLWPQTTYQGRRSENLPEDVREKFDKLEVAIFSATMILEIAVKNLDEAAFNKILNDVQALGINLVDEADKPEAWPLKHYVGLRGDFGWLPFMGAHWPG